VQSLGAIPFDLVKFRAFSSLFILSSFSSRLRQRVSGGGSTGIKEQVLTRQRQQVLTKQAVAAKMVVAVLLSEISVLSS